MHDSKNYACPYFPACCTPGDRVRVLGGTQVTGDVQKLWAVAHAAEAYRQAKQPYDAFHLHIFHERRAPNAAESQQLLELRRACNAREAELFKALDDLAHQSN